MEETVMGFWDAGGQRAAKKTSTESDQTEFEQKATANY